MRDKSGRVAALATLALVALLGLVALGARSVPGTGERAFRLDAGLDAALVARLLFALLVLGGIVLGIIGLSSRRPRRGRATGKRSSIVGPAIVLVALLVVFLNLGRALDVTAPDRATADTAAPAPVASIAETSGSRWGFLLLGGAVLIAVAALAVARRRPVPDPVAATTPAASLHTVLDETIAAIGASDDPRTVVINAYFRIERVLQHEGYPRRPSEAPREFLGRVLAGLDVQPRAIIDLTALFEEARFGRHAVARDMAHAAVAAMEAVQADLTERSR